MTMQHKSSITHQRHLELGLTVLWERFTGSGDKAWSVVCYSDDSRWLFDNGGAERLTLLGTVSDGLNKAEILESSIGAIIALYGEGPEAFESREAWIESMAESDKEEARKMLGEERLPDLRHLSCPVGNQWSKFEWSKADGDAESCQCGGCGTWQSAEEAWKQYENQNREAK